MVDRDANVGREFDTPKKKRTSPVLDFSTSTLSERGKANDAFGDLMRSLSDSYENRRARQASEWETLRRQNLRRAS